MTVPPSVLTYWGKGLYELGLEHYAALKSPEPSDERWAGYCHLALGQTFAARACLSRVAHLGVTSACIGLGQLYMLEGQFQLAAEALDRVNEKELDDLDWVLLHRGRGTLAHHHGRLSEATEHLERAWYVTHGLTDFPVMTCAVAHHLAGLYFIRGRDQRATPFLQYALDHDDTGRRPYLLGLCALAHGYQGEYTQAQARIREALKLIDSFPSARATLQYELGVISRLCGTLSVARRAFEEASTTAETMGDLETQWYAEVGLMNVDLEEGNIHEASQHLAQLRQLGTTEVMRAHLTLRSEALKTISNPEAITQVATFFQEREYLREASWSWLRATEAYLQLEDRTNATRCLIEVGALVYVLGSVASLQAEMRTLPLTTAYLQTNDAPTSLSALMTQRPATLDVAQPVHVISLGSPRLLQGTLEVKPVMKRSLEVLCFLLDHPGTSLHEIQARLFPDTPPRQAKSYFHQVRADLKRVAGLEVPYCRATKTYAVHLDSIELTWDLLQLREALREAEEDAHKGLDGLVDACRPFLDGADGTWVSEERTHLKHRIIRVGLARLGLWFEEGKFSECLRLARQLQKLDPCDDILNEFLIKSTQKVSGNHAGRHMIQELREVYQREFADEPSFLAALDQQLKYN